MVTALRTCHICHTVVPAKEFCSNCIENFKHCRRADEMLDEEREIEMRLLEGPLEIPFNLLHKRIEELVGRPVWTHEMGLNWEGLVAEASHRDHPTFQEVVELIPKNKRLVVNPEDPEDMNILMDTLRQKRGMERKRSVIVTSFAELEGRRRVKPGVLVQTLYEYAFGGLAINAHVVIKLIHKVQRRISRLQLKQLARAAEYGVRDQAGRGFDADAGNYQQVLELTNLKLSR